MKQPRPQNKAWNLNRSISAYASARLVVGAGLALVAIGAPAGAQVSSPGTPAYSGLFTAQEKQRHAQNVRQIVTVAAQCLETTYQIHVDFHRLWGVSKFYGDRHPQYGTRQGRLNELRRLGKPDSLINELQPISCIGLTVKCLGEGFQAGGMNSTWDKIYQRLQPDMMGTTLQQLLIELGWRSYYWNPDPSQNARWDEEDRRLTPLAAGRRWMGVWGGHEVRYRQVLRTQVYHDVPVHDWQTLVGFGSQAPQALARSPFFVGIAHAGYHVFPGRDGRVIEAHSTRRLDSIDNLEYSQFNPLGNGGGPRWTRTEKYRSGTIVVPWGL